MALSYVPYAGPVVKRSVAMAAGEKYYFSGLPCKSGHFTQRRVIGGTCPNCRDSYTLDPEKTRARQKRWEEANGDKIRERGRNYSREHREQSNAWAAIPENRAKKNATDKIRRQEAFAADPEGQREKWRLDYAKDPLAARSRTQRWQAANKEQMAEYRVTAKDAIAARSKKWATENPERVRARVRKYQLAHPETGINWKKANPANVKAIKQNRRSRERNAEGKHTAAEIRELFERQGGKCPYCKVSLKGGYDVDHKQPLSRGGSNWITNIQLLCGSCNNRKWATDPLEYARRLGRLL